VEDSEVALALTQAQKEQELSHLRARIVALETRLSEDALVAQAKINDLEATLAANNTAIQSVQKELSSVKIQAELDSKALEVRISHSLEEAATQRSRVEDLLTSNLGMRARLCWAKEQLHKYKGGLGAFIGSLLLLLGCGTRAFIWATWKV
jgi:chromosome segregation ATPase